MNRPCSTLAPWVFSCGSDKHPNERAQLRSVAPELALSGLKHASAISSLRLALLNWLVIRRYENHPAAYAFNILLKGDLHETKYTFPLTAA